MKHRTIAYLYAFTLIVFGVGLSFLASTTTRADELNMGLIIYWYILPGLPFVCLGLFGAFRANQFSLRPFVGATIGALVAVSVPYGSLWLASVTYKGGGANIGLGLLLLAFPVYLPFAIFGGWRIGKSKSSEIESKST